MSDAQLATSTMTGLVSGRYFGKYRGTVVENADPMMIGRILAIVPDVSNTFPTSWAMPCLPWGGIQTGVFCVPPIGAGVWVEFEQGDPDYPVWTGCYWGSAAEVPAAALLSPPPIPAITLQTTPIDIRSARSDRRHHDQEHDGRVDYGQRNRDYHPERAGRLDRDGRTVGHDQ